MYSLGVVICGTLYNNKPESTNLLNLDSQSRFINGDSSSDLQRQQDILLREVVRTLTDDVNNRPTASEVVPLLNNAVNLSLGELRFTIRNLKSELRIQIV